MPDEQTLSEMLKLAFYASLEREEGRPVQVSLMYATPHHLGLRSKDTWSPLKFDQPRPATVSEIAHLAQATDSHQTFIALVKTEDGLQVVGLIRTNRDQYRRARNETRTAKSIEMRCPRITALAPGVLTAGLLDSDLMRFKNGCIELPTANILCQNGLIHTRLFGYATSHFANPLVGMSPCELYTELVGDLLQHIVDARHGGTVVIVDTPAAIADAKVKFGTDCVDLQAAFRRHVSQFANKRNVERLAAEARKQDKHLPKTDPAVRADRAKDAYDAVQAWPIREWYTQDAIAAAANLANVDGALLLGPDLTIYGFGAMFKWREGPLEAFQALDCSALSRAPIDLARFGSRHRSAAWFCRQHPGSMAFVVSEDGPLSCFYTLDEEDVLLVWTPVSLAWVEAEPTPAMLLGCHDAATRPMIEAMKRE